LPVRVRLDAAETLEGLLARLQDQQAELMPYQYLGLTDIQTLTGFNELFDTLVVFENYPLDSKALELPGESLAVTGIDGRDATHYPLILTALPGERIQLRLDFREDLFDRAGAERVMGRLVRVLETATDRHAEPVGRINLLTEQELERVLVEWNGTGGEVPSGTVPEV
ncbi:non-ribosomal peptide synthetase, partial [Streptomyces sp. M2CJ-2]|uniref:condensation domain-containing protein n=1 Tax=Streptomyces sp. M2CJ-2 TaxID=2803948 RepID=UPI001A57E7AF